MRKTHDVFSRNVDVRVFHDDNFIKDGCCVCVRVGILLVNCSKRW